MMRRFAIGLPTDTHRHFAIGLPTDTQKNYSARAPVIIICVNKNNIICFDAVTGFVYFDCSVLQT